MGSDYKSREGGKAATCSVFMGAGGDRLVIRAASPSFLVLYERKGVWGMGRGVLLLEFAC